MKKILQNIFLILDRQEKNKLIRLTVFDTIISLLDIAFLALLLYVIHFYANSALSEVEGLKTQSTTLSAAEGFFRRYPLSLISIFLVLYAIKNWLGFLVSRSQLRFVYGVASRLSEKKLLDFLNGTYRNYTDTDSSVHIRSISQQPIEFCHYILNGVQQIAGQSILILITIVAILIFNPVLFPLLFVILIPPVILIAFLVKRRLNAIRKMAKPVSEKTLQHLKESLSGFIESNVYEKKDFFTGRYHAFQSKFNHFLSEQQAMLNMPSRMIEVFAIFGLFVLVLLHSFMTEAVQLITIGAFMAAAYKIIPGMVKIINSAGQIRTYSFTIDGLLVSQPPLTSLTNMTSLASLTNLTSVEFNNISFKYKEETILSNFSFSFKQGDFAALSAPSGKGKTTIVNLLLGFLQPQNGSVLLNGNTTTQQERSSYWNRIAYVKQQSFLIHDTIWKNIVLADSFDEVRLKEVIKSAGLDSFVAQFPEGIHAVLGEEGKNISGGQRQRIAIARALYKDADLVILDEPFNELDKTSEQCLLQHFQSLAAAGKMILLITHNKESHSYCNKLILLDEK